MRTVDQNYWLEYYKVYNSKRYDDLVNIFFAEDAVFQNPKFTCHGRNEIASFFTEHHTLVSEELVPRTLVLTPEVCAIEIDGIFIADIDVPDFYIVPLKKGKAEPWAMSAFYHMKGDRITRARVFWMGNTKLL